MISEGAALRKLACEKRNFKRAEPTERILGVLQGLEIARVAIVEAIKESPYMRLAYRDRMYRWRAAMMFKCLETSLHMLMEGNRGAAIRRLKKEIEIAKGTTANENIPENRSRI